MMLGNTTERLAGNSFVVDEGQPHIQVDQESAARTGAGPLLVRVCPAHVYSLGADGRIDVAWAGCLECGTCLAVAPEGVLRWHYPRGGFGIGYRLG
jgi:ferredoxin like protein